MIIDLHTHTFHSDGALGPAELVRRAEVAGYGVVGLTDHVDASNIDSIISRMLVFWRETQPHLSIRILAGVEITHVPPPQIPALVTKARSLGAHLVLVHGETVSEPVAAGTNRAAIEAKVDVLAHPGILTDEEAARAAENGVALEITARPAHGLTNGLVVSMARSHGVKLVLNSDTHDPSDLLSPDKKEKVLLGSGLSQEEIQQIDLNMSGIVADNVRRIHFA
jgi:histidinol phosphatase-like PHP family hydrolase